MSSYYPNDSSSSDEESEEEAKVTLPNDIYFQNGQFYCGTCNEQLDCFKDGCVSLTIAACSCMLSDNGNNGNKVCEDCGETMYQTTRGKLYNCQADDIDYCHCDGHDEVLVVHDNNHKEECPTNKTKIA